MSHLPPQVRFCFPSDSVPFLQLLIVFIYADSVFPSRLCLGSTYKWVKMNDVLCRRDG